MTSREENTRSGPPKSRNRPYDNRPRSGPVRPKRRPSQANAVRVVLPGEPPRLTPGAARALLRVLLKAHDQLNASDDPQSTREDHPGNVARNGGQNPSEPDNVVPEYRQNFMKGETVNIAINGWTYNPAEQAWTARVAEGRWLRVQSGIGDPPAFRPEAIAGPGR